MSSKRMSILRVLKIIFWVFVTLWFFGGFGNIFYKVSCTGSDLRRRKNGDDGVSRIPEPHLAMPNGIELNAEENQQYNEVLDKVLNPPMSLNCPAGSLVCGEEQENRCSGESSNSVVVSQEPISSTTAWFRNQLQVDGFLWGESGIPIKIGDIVKNQKELSNQTAVMPQTVTVKFVVWHQDVRLDTVVKTYEELAKEELLVLVQIPAGGNTKFFTFGKFFQAFFACNQTAFDRNGIDFSKMQSGTSRRLNMSTSDTEFREVLRAGAFDAPADAYRVCVRNVKGGSIMRVRYPVTRSSNNADTLASSGTNVRCFHFGDLAHNVGLFAPNATTIADLKNGKCGGIYYETAIFSAFDSSMRISDWLPVQLVGECPPRNLNLMSLKSLMYVLFKIPHWRVLLPAGFIITAVSQIVCFYYRFARVRPVANRGVVEQRMSSGRLDVVTGSLTTYADGTLSTENSATVSEEDLKEGIVFMFSDIKLPVASTLGEKEKLEKLREQTIENMCKTLNCSVTQSPFSDPVTFRNGTTCGKQAAEEWLYKHTNWRQGLSLLLHLPFESLQSWNFPIALPNRKIADIIQILMRAKNSKPEKMRSKLEQTLHGQKGIMSSAFCFFGRDNQLKHVDKKEMPDLCEAQECVRDVALSGFIEEINFLTSPGA